ncbi:unnamed protein product [Cylindrotheca closterium]|uniref:Uncharacterized protein n=1 Tax=Cylindrotheca closterium TaxID=2856 RepID=A0AAD2G9X4_9STRA|nr:unnamed protein product [Cylindrotheca closterium]
MVSIDSQKSPWSPEDAMELRGKISEENNHLDHIFHDESSSSGEESSLVGTRIDGFFDAAADMIQRHLRINVDGNDEDFDIDHIDDEEDDEYDDYDGDDDESEAFDYSVFSKHTVDSITSHHSGSRASNHDAGLRTQDKDLSKEKKNKGPSADNEKSLLQSGESAETSQNSTRSIDGAKGRTYDENQSCDGRCIDEKSFSGLRSIQEDNIDEEDSSGSHSAQETTVDDGSACSGNKSFGGRSYDERSFAGLRSVLQLESTDDDGDDDNDANNAWLPSSQQQFTDEKSASGLESTEEDANDEGSASGFQSLGMHSTQETTIEEASTSGLQSFGMHSTQDTTIDEGTTSGSRSFGLHSTQEATIDEGTTSGSGPSNLHSTQESTIDDGSTSGSGPSNLHSTPETSIDEGSRSVSQSLGLHSTQETTIDEGSTSGSQSFSLHSTQETTIDEGSTLDSPSFGIQSIQETTIETRSSFGLRPIQETPIDEKLINVDDFPKEEGLFGALSTNKRRFHNGQSRKGVHSMNEITCRKGHLSDGPSHATRSDDSRSNCETTYDEDTRNTSHDSDSAYFTDEYTNYDTTFTQSTMTSKYYPEVKVNERKKSLEKTKKEPEKSGFYIPKKTRDRVQHNPGSRFVDVRDYYIYSDENSIVTQSSFKKKDVKAPSSKGQTKSSDPKRRTKSSPQKRRMKVKRSTLIDKEIKENESYTEDYSMGCSMDEHTTVQSAIKRNGRKMKPYRTSPHLRAISDDVSQITMSVAMSNSYMDESFDGTNSLTTHQSHFENPLETCEECSQDYTATELDTSSVALLSGHSNLDDDRSGKKDSVFDQIRDMVWRKKKDKKEKENTRSQDLEQEGLNQARLLEIVKREAKLEEAAWKRIERRQSERKDADIRPQVQSNSEFNRFALKQSFAIEKLDESFFSQQNGDNSLIDSMPFAEDSKSTVSNATSDSVLMYNRERSQLLHNRRMARNIRQSPSKSTEDKIHKTTWRSSVSDVGVSTLDNHEKALEGFLTRKPASMEQGDVLARIPARGSTPRDKLRARMLARSKFAAIDSAKVKRDFFEKSAKCTEQVQAYGIVTKRNALKYKARAASPAALSSTGILKTMAPQLPIKPVHRLALDSPASSALKAKRVSFATPEKFEFVMKEDLEQLPLQSKGSSPKLNDSFDQLVQKRRHQRSPFQNAKKISGPTTQRSQPVTPNLYRNQSPRLLPPSGSNNSSPTSVLDLPSPEDSYSGSPRIANLELLEEQKAKKLVYGDDDDDDDVSSEQSSVLMDLSVV